MSSIYLPYQKIPRWNASRATVAYNCARLGLPMPIMVMPIWEGAGNKIYDYSGQQDHINLYNTSWDGNRVYFVNAGNSWGNGPSLHLTGPFTILMDYEMVVLPPEQIAVIGSHDVLSWSFDWYLWQRDSADPDQELSFGVYNTVGTFFESRSPASLVVGTRYQIGGVFDGGSIRCIIDGKFYNQTNIVGILRDSGYNTVLSRTNWRYDLRYKTSYIYIFPVNLTQQQVATIYANPYGMFEPVRSPQWIVPLGATTVAPTTVAPTTAAPTSLAPTSLAPTTAPPADIRSSQVLAQVEWVEHIATTAPPTTIASTTPAPTTAAPTTAAPTVAPSTTLPTTVAPTTPAPPPTTLAPTTVAPPTTLAPTTPTLTTLAPTTAAPETICIKALNSIIAKELSLGSLITKEIRSNGYLC